MRLPNHSPANLCHLLCYLLCTFLFDLSTATSTNSPSILDNGVSGLPEVDCMEDRVKLTFNTAKPFTGRIFVKGMVDKPACVQKFESNANNSVHFELQNGACNMRRHRMIQPDKRGMEQSITIIISFHSTFITKVDRAFRTTCFYMEADKVVTSRFDVSMLPTTDLVDTAKMPLCTYSVRRDSIDGPVVQYATVGEVVYHVWQCDSDMFSMLVHSCFVDDGNGQDRKPILDERGCSIDEVIVPDLTYNAKNNLAYAPVSVFKFADKVTTYFQCAVSTCMLSEGMCEGKTPPACGASRGALRLVRSIDELVNRTRSSKLHLDGNTMDLAAQKIMVLDMEEYMEGDRETPSTNPKIVETFEHLLPLPHHHQTGVCLSPHLTAALTSLSAFSFLLCLLLGYYILSKRRQSKDFN